MARVTPSYAGFKPASATAIYVHSRGAKKTDTHCEQQLRGALFRLGLRFRKNVKTLPGVPDIVFPRHKLVVFCDGDFWHGKDWKKRKQRLANGTNSAYWVKKIDTNMARDRRHDALLRREGWTVLRVWESEIKADVARLARTIAEQLRKSSRQQRAPSVSAETIVPQ